MTQPSTFSGTVFTDSNDDGLVDGADTGLGGVTVQLLNGDGTPTGLTTTTAANGSYSFTNLAAGSYSARVLLPSTPSGATFSPYGSTTPPQPTGGAVSAEQNLLTNGSFETAGANTTALGYAGWTSSTNTAMTPFGSGPGDGPEIAITNGSSAYAIDPQNQTNPYAGVVAPDSADPNYLGGSGTHAAFFVDDGAIESISQTVKLTAGQTYEVGFDLLETTPGQNNPGFFSLSAAIGGQTITTAGSTSGTKLTPGVWTHFADLFTPTTTGTFTLTFSYASGVPGSSLASKDVLVDDVYVVPGQVTANLTTTSEVNAQGVTAPVTLGAGQSVGNESAGIYLPPATISGTVFTDANADGVKQTGDAGLSGRTVNLATGGVITATTVTDASGNYSFTNQAAGTYTVTVVAPSGDHFSSVGSSSTQTNSTVGSGGTQTVTVSNGGSATVNAGVYAPATIKGTIFTDANGDGVEQATDSGLGGVTVKLLGAGGSVVATTTTAASGAYSFTGQTPGSYTVQVVTPSGDGVSPNGTSTTLTDSTVGTGASQAVTVASGGSATVNAGLYAPSSISGTVFSDANADGAQQAGDAGLGGQTVELLGAGGQVIATTTTATNGGYSFTGVAPGTDTVVVAVAPGDVFSPGIGADGTAAVTVTAGSASTVDAGEYAPATVEGTVFSDTNADGVQEAGESGIAGQIVELVGDGGYSLASTTTDAAGHYAFGGVVPGAYSVQVLPPAGTLFSPGSAAAQPVSVTAGAEIIVDTAEYSVAGVSGTVFADTNGDGAQEVGEAGISGVTVNLLDGATVLATTTTDAQGGYSFQRVAPGAGTVQVVAPAGEVFSAVGTNPSLLDSTVAGDGTQTLAVGSGAALQVNAGLFVPAAIGGQVFLDAHYDGLDDLGDPAFSGVVVKLYDGAGNFTGMTATTDSSGHYSFANLVPGSYQVQFVAPSGTAFAQEHAGSDRTIDSDANASGRSEVFTLAAGQTDITRNAGLTLTGGYANTGVVTGSGNLYGGGDSIVIGGSGDNTIEGGSGTNLIIGGSGPYAQIQGLGGTDIIYGGAGDDLIQGHAGNEFIAAGVGNQTLVGGGGANVFIANANSGTITDTDGVFSGISGGDVFVTHGNTASIYQAGDGVLTIDDYDASAGDTLQVYGYSAPVAVGQSMGYEVLYFGANSAILVRANNTTVSADGVIQGVSFAQAAPAAPLSTVAVTAANYLTLTEAGSSTPLIGPGNAPTITGAVAAQTVADTVSITPFSGLVIADPNPAQTETVTVTPFAQDGSFSRLGGGSVANGVYTVTGTPQTVTAALDALVFNPTFHQAAVGQTVTTGFEVTVIDAAGYSRSDSTTSVIATATDLAPTIAGAVADQAANTGAGAHPFAGVSIGDPDGGMTETVTVTLSNPAGGTLSNLGNGHYDAASGVYTTVGTASAVTANLDQVVFTPATGSTGFTIAVSDNAGGTASSATTSVTATATITPAPVTVTAPAAATDANQSVVQTGWNNVVTVGDGNVSIDAGYGNATITAGNGNDIIKVGGYSNVVTVGAGTDTIDAGSNASITAAGGSQAITLNGYGNMVFIGGSTPGTSVINGGLGNSQITTTAGSASITLAGYGNVVTTGGANDTIADGAGGTQFVVGPTQAGLSGGAEIITNFQASSLVDIIRGAGGVQTAGDAYNALTAVNGGTRLDLGAGGSVTFLGVAPGDLNAANFKIG